MRIKDLALKTLIVPGTTVPFARLLQGRATILMLHRIRNREQGNDGLDPVALRDGLEYLRRRGYELVGLEELIHRLSGSGPRLQRAVAFTMDDGYFEQAEFAGPIFARFDCPVTTFVTTGFVDGKLWFWWDQVEHIFLTTPRGEVSALLPDGEVRYAWVDAIERHRAQAHFIAWGTRVAEHARRLAIASLSRSAEVEIPALPPPRYRPMSWDQVRDCEKHGMRFGPHTVTHPFLSRVSDERSRSEVTASWARLCAEASDPIPMFCYPHGDFGLREQAILEKNGFLGAVTTTLGYADTHSFRQNPAERFRLPRFGYPADLPHLIQIVAGVERLKQIIRREAFPVRYGYDTEGPCEYSG